MGEKKQEEEQDGERRKVDRLIWILNIERLTMLAASQNQHENPRQLLNISTCFSCCYIQLRPRVHTDQCLARARIAGFDSGLSKESRLVVVVGRESQDRLLRAGAVLLLVLAVTLVTPAFLLSRAPHVAEAAGEVDFGAHAAPLPVPGDRP